jgi:excisionase family DNA binding protein
MKFSGIKEYANSRGLAYSTVYAMCRDGTLPAVKIGQRHKIEVEALIVILMNKSNFDKKSYKN